MMVGVSGERIDALRALARDPRPPWADIEGRDELGDDGARALIDGPDAGAVYSFWRDARRGRVMGDDLVALALTRTCEVWAAGDEATTLDEAVDDAFATLSGGGVAASAVPLFLAAWSEAMSRRRRVRDPRSGLELWRDVTARNTLVALSPERLAPELVLGCDAGGVSSWAVATIHAVATPASAGHLYPRSVAMWDRFGMEAGVTLDAARVAWVRDAWSDANLRRLLEAARRELHEPFASAASEVLELTIDAVLPHRLEQMLTKLTQPTPSEWWDDEYGVAP